MVMFLYFFRVQQAKYMYIHMFLIRRPKFVRLDFQEEVSAIFDSYRGTAKKHSPVDIVQ